MDSKIELFMFLLLLIIAACYYYAGIGIAILVGLYFILRAIFIGFYDNISAMGTINSSLEEIHETLKELQDTLGNKN